MTLDNQSENVELAVNFIFVACCKSLNMATVQSFIL